MTRAGNDVPRLASHGASVAEREPGADKIYECPLIGATIATPVATIMFVDEAQLEQLVAADQGRILGTCVSLPDRRR